MNLEMLNEIKDSNPGLYGRLVEIFTESDKDAVKDRQMLIFGHEASLDPGTPMARRNDLKTSQAAAEAVRKSPKLSRLRVQVLYEIADHGPINDTVLERRPVFKGYKYSTVSKRRTELRDAGFVESAGQEVHEGNTMFRWRLTEAGREKAAELRRLGHKGLEEYASLLC
jgi:DNA-binding transcriptional ArsR family regulator